MKSVLDIICRDNKSATFMFNNLF